MPPQNFFTGTPARTETFQRFTPQQQSLQNQAIGQLMSYLGGGAGGFAPIEQRARTQFQTQTIPGLAERFTALGGGQRSSAFQGALGQAGAGLEETLAALQSQHQLGQQGLLGQLAFQPSFEQAYFPREPGFAESAIPDVFKTLLNILPQLLPFILGTAGTALGGPIGGAAGTAAGTGLSAYFGGK